MAKLIWLGEPEGEEEGPRKNTWNGITFIRGEEVEVDNAHMIAKARRNPFYSVDGVTYDPKADGKKAERHQESSGPVIQDKTQYSEMTVAELRGIASDRNIDVDGLKKAEIVEKLASTPAA